MSGTINIAREGWHATITIDNVAKRNAMTQAMWIAMGDAVLALSDEPDLRCIVIRGAGDTAFGSGADIDEFSLLRADKDKAIAFARHGHRAMHAVRDCPIPTVAAIQGICVGGGMELAAYCDLRLCNAQARFGIPIARLGATLAYPELAGLVRLAGSTVALELLLEGGLLDAKQAYEKGIVTRVIPTGEDFSAAVSSAVARIVANAPLSARWHKKFVAELRRGAALSDEALAEGYACFDTQDYQIGYRAFIDKRVPEFKGR